ncbi:Ferritin [Sedimentisphaera cyanobacteriorum]|uniref:Ferritin n=1 Tax=Sedimentisphaera cyanobacteriorum TaxID=1940790 RepID=A0A1Q2HQN7_9BACT|nr:ferritin [Sedimentisphaera cyanobacteriorum]AQQ09722.1 Ferritin [Sedimentisphaera cyanobacteriorum]
MIKDKVNKAINSQINAELYSSYLYLAMSAWFADNGMPGAANWTKIQAQEELTHADKFFEYVLERGGKIELDQIDKPEGSWDSPIEVFEAVLAHEQKVTSLINDLMDVAISENDHASKIFLNWFVEEQVEEEASVQDIIDKAKMACETKGGLFMIDKELGQRVFNPAPSE